MDFYTIEIQIFLSPGGAPPQPPQTPPVAPSVLPPTSQLTSSTTNIICIVNLPNYINLPNLEKLPNFKIMSTTFWELDEALYCPDMPRLIVLIFNRKKELKDMVWTEMISAMEFLIIKAHARNRVYITAKCVQQ